MFYKSGNDGVQVFVICYGTKDMEISNYKKGTERFDNIEIADEFLVENDYVKYGYFYYGKGEFDGSLAYITVH